VVEKRVLVVDTTLRDGEQMPGVCFPPERKLELAQRISEFGAGIIEVMPVVSPAEAETAKRIAAMRLLSELRAVCRLRKEDVEESAACGVDRLLLVAPASDLHLKVKFGAGREEGLARLLECVDFAKSYCGKIDVALEDASRADEGYLCEISDALSGKIGLLLFGDSLGVLTPFKTRSLIGKLKGRPKPCKIEFHGHNDFGLATANTLAAVAAGADAFTATFLGIGERAGNASMEEVAVALKFIEGVDAGLRLEQIAAICGLVAKSIGIPVPPNKPWAGRNIFTHESGIHADAVLKDPRTYEALQPGTVGQKRRIVFGKTTGRRALDSLLKENGVRLAPETLLSVKRAVQDFSVSNNRTLTEREVLGIAGRIYGGMSYGSG